MSELQGKRAVVLGGSRGIGAAVVERLSAEGVSTHFTFSGSLERAETLAAKSGAQAHKVNSANRDELTHFIGSLGSIDILVVSAGVFIMGEPQLLDPDAVDHMIDVNVRAPYHASVEASKHMPDGGRIIIIGSTNGDRMPMGGAAAYALTKSAMQGMVRGLARDLGERQITVNNVQPGPTDTDMNPVDGPMKDFMHAFMAIKRHAKTSEVASLVAYLAGPQAGIITGAQHTIDGGFAA
ncbi:MAG: SDR family oxidoreductase [Pseudomonadota bacterium]